jgi:putrescine transport system ATP-binding protein
VTAQPAACGFLRIEEVVKSFDGVLAVDRVSLEISQGEIFALLGSSGCGKTTLLRMVAGFESPTSGRILLEGRDLAGLPPYERPLNMMFQNYALFPHLSVSDNVAFGLRRAGLPAAQVAARVEALLKLVQLSRLAQRKPHQLSGGQQQRVALARSLARQPRLLLLDEPLGALDRKLREETRIELMQIIQQVGVTCLMVTHDQEEAMTMASRMAVMHEGRLLQVGTPSAIYETPASRFVADFIGNVNLVDGRVQTLTPDQMVVATPDGPWLLAPVPHTTVGMSVTLALRPEKIWLSRQAPADGSGDVANAVKGVVREKAYFGSFTVYHLGLPSGAVLKVAPAHVDRGAPPRDPAHGDEVWAHWAASAPVMLPQ